MSLERHFTNLDVGMHCDDDSSRLIKMIKRYAGRVTKLELNSVPLTTSEMIELLQQLPTLEELIWHYNAPVYYRAEWPQTQRDRFTDYSENIPTFRVTLNKLRKLKVTDDWKWFAALRTPALKSLEASETAYNLNLKYFDLFLKACPQLESLRIPLELFKNMEPGYPFNLKNFIASESAFDLIDYITFNTDEFTINVKKFILSQAASLETFETKSRVSKLHEIILTKSKHLKSLKVDLSGLKISQEFLTNIKPLLFLTEISLHNGFSSERDMRAVLGNCPALVKLECTGNWNIPDYLDIIADNNCMLELLTIPKIGANNAKFPFLKTLNVMEIEDAHHLFDFLNSNPTIVNLEIGKLGGSFDREAYDALINGTTLKNVHIKSHIF